LSGAVRIPGLEAAFVARSTGLRAMKPWAHRKGRTMRKLSSFAVAIALVCCLSATIAVAHFQVLKPSTDIVTAGGSKTVNLDILFTHPMEQGPVMEMGVPVQFGVLVDGEKHDLRETLTAKDVDGATTYACSYKVKAPADYVFYIEPAPYWEPAEQKMIVHYTKVVVDAFAAEEGWDDMVGFPVEIEPLVRPYGLWTGNAFRGIVKKDGKPVPFAEIEVEYWNEGGEVVPPADVFVTQVVKADSHGVFSYVMPRAGWWGFAALVDGDSQMESPAGEMVDVELGALMWVKTVDME
jgi:cobalt/nickel transport protein